MSRGEGSFLVAAHTGKPFLLLTAVGAGPGYSLHSSYQRSHFFRWYLVPKASVGRVGYSAPLLCLHAGILPSQLCSCLRCRGSTSKDSSESWTPPAPPGALLRAAQGVFSLPWRQPVPAHTPLFPVYHPQQ